MAEEEYFKSLVMRYVEVCEKIGDMSGLRKQQKELGKEIQEFMKKHDIAQCNLRDGGRLVLAESKKVAPVKKEQVAEQLAHKVGTTEAESIANIVWSNRPVTTNQTLKHLKRGGETA